MFYIILIHSYLLNYYIFEIIVCNLYNEYKEFGIYIFYHIQCKLKGFSNIYL